MKEVELYTMLFLSESNIWTSKFCATKKAIPEPIAILIDIRSEKFVDIKSVSSMPITKPMYTIFLAINFP